MLLERLLATVFRQFVRSKRLLKEGQHKEQTDRSTENQPQTTDILIELICAYVHFISGQVATPSPESGHKGFVCEVVEEVGRGWREERINYPED